jgi:FMN phosphatase YigB (HAD superfamily)
VLKAILFDLDGTLLKNSMEIFGPALLQSLARHMAQLIPPEHTTSALESVIAAMDANEGTGLTNEEVFAAAFYPAVGYEREDLAGLIERFWSEEFPKLRELTRSLPEARLIIEWAFQHGLQVAIATGFLFPRTVAEQRLEWAGVPVTEFDYTLLATWSNMHASKPHPAYYREVLAHLGRQPDECLMVGDDWEHDIIPATSVGIPSYWIAEPDDQPPEQRILHVGQGTLSDLLAWLRNADSQRSL